MSFLHPTNRDHAAGDHASRNEHDAVPNLGGFGRIVVPVNPVTWSSPDALPVATALAQRTGGQIRLVHVRMYDRPARGTGRFFPETERQATAVLEDALPTAWSAGVPAGGVVVEAARDRIASAIAEEAAAWDADIIVMTDRPRGLPSLMVRGAGMAQRVMREAACPVLAVRPSESGSK
jgi:nucleotide-binding universal stress UspA family protein